jgi:hypothetical protein
MKAQKREVFLHEFHELARRREILTTDGHGWTPIQRLTQRRRGRKETETFNAQHSTPNVEGKGQAAERQRWSLVTSSPTGKKSFYTKRSQFLPKTIRLQLVADANVAKIVPRKSVGILYTKRTQFWGKIRGRARGPACARKLWRGRRGGVETGTRKHSFPACVQRLRRERH